MKKSGSGTAAVDGSAPPTSVRGQTGRPRSDASRRAVLDAAYGILIETGLGGFSVEAVATRSGVARTTIYRWWPTKGLLAMEGFREAHEGKLVFERTDDPEADVRALVMSLARALGGPAGRLAASVLAEAQSDPEARGQFLEHFSMPLRRRSTEVLMAGVSKKAFRADLDIPAVIDAMVGAVYFRLMTGLDLDQDWAASLASTLLRGCSLRETL